MRTPTILGDVILSARFCAGLVLRHRSIPDLILSPSQDEVPRDAVQD